MGIIQRLSRHADLVRDMCATQGVDLGRAIGSGELDPLQLRYAIMRCTTCRHVGECQHWLAEHAEADSPPDYCLNGDMISELSHR